MDLFFSSFSWMQLSKKLLARIDNPQNGGFFSEEDAGASQMRLIIGKQGEKSEGNVVYLYWLVDLSDGVIADAKFQAFGECALIGAAEAACELLVRKNYDQARRVTADLIDKHMRDQSEERAFPTACLPLLNLVVSAIHHAADQCGDIPFEEVYMTSPLPVEFTPGQVYAGWKDLDTPQKIAVIESVIATDIRPYIELDAGGVQVIDLLNDSEVIIAYQGSCTSCHSATGSTLNAIQQVLCTKIHPDLIVTPDLASMT